MKTYAKALQLLYIGHSTSDLSRLVEELSHAGYQAAAQFVENELDFRAALASEASEKLWDVILSVPDAPELTVDVALTMIRQSERDIPFILLGEDLDAETVAAAMRSGAANYVARKNLSRLGPVIEREKQEAKTRSVRRQAELALVEGEERYRAVTESAFDLVCEIDAEGRYFYCSPNYPQVLGYIPAELIGRPVFDRVHADDVEAVVREYTAALSGQRSGEATYRYKSKDGEDHWFEATLRGIRSGSHRRVVQISREITAHKRYEAELASLIALAKGINAQSELPDLVRELTSGLRGLLHFDSLLLALRDDQSGEAVDTLQLVQSNGDGVQRLTRQDNGAHPIWQAIDRGELWLVNDWQRLPFSADVATRAFLSVPLRIDQQNWGVLHLDSLSPYVFTDEHARVASMVAEQVAVAARQSHYLEQARAAKEKFRALVNDVNAVVWEIDPVDLRITYISPQVEEWLGYAPERLMYDPALWSSLIHVDDRERVINEMKRSIAAGEDHQVDYRVIASDGRQLWLRNLVNVETREDIPGMRVAVKLTGVSIDITERKHAEESLRASNAVLSATQEAVADGICLVDEKGAVVSFNTRFRDMWRIPSELVAEVHGRGQLMACVLAALQQPGEFVDKMNFLREHPESPSRDEVSLKDGRVFQRYSAPATSPDGRTFGRVWTFSDISDSKRYEQQLAHQAFHDPLTDLPNRTLFVDRVNHAISHLGRVYPAIAVLFLDLDRFKVINDSMGHAVGDWLLTEVGRRLLRCMRPGDTAARFGGDEFTLLLENISDVNDAALVAERILECLNAPFIAEGRELYVTSSIGIAVTSSREEQAEALLRNADVAMYRAKNKGKARFEVFDMKMSAVALERLQLEIELRQAVKWQQLHLDYQPLVDLESDKIIGVEALVRWNHPQRGLVSPDDFIPIAEESGMIVSIGRWVLREACEQAVRWQKELPQDPPLKMSVNLSAKQFQQSNIIEDVETVLRETGYDPAYLELEITESAIMEDAETTIEQLEALKRLGVKLAIDDFGTGYSSLSYIERFPLDVLKIDRSFVSQIGVNGNGKKGGKNGDRSVVMQAVSSLGLGLGVCITAEGIETDEQLQHLRELGCNIGQGFLFARPLTSAKVEKLLREGFAKGDMLVGAHNGNGNGHNGNGHNGNSHD